MNILQTMFAAVPAAPAAMAAAVPVRASVHAAAMAEPAAMAVPDMTAQAMAGTKPMATVAAQALTVVLLAPWAIFMCTRLWLPQ